MCGRTASSNTGNADLSLGGLMNRDSRSRVRKSAVLDWLGGLITLLISPNMSL